MGRIVPSRPHVICLNDVMLIKQCIKHFKQRRNNVSDRSGRTVRNGSATACLLGLRVRIPPGEWMSLACECCVLSDRGLCDGPIPHPEIVCH
jgi:hypothetical protein